MNKIFIHIHILTALLSATYGLFAENSSSDKKIDIREFSKKQKENIVRQVSKDIPVLIGADNKLLLKN